MLQWGKRQSPGLVNGMKPVLLNRKFTQDRKIGSRSENIEHNKSKAAEKVKKKYDTVYFAHILLLRENALFSSNTYYVSTILPFVWSVMKDTVRFFTSTSGLQCCSRRRRVHWTCLTSMAELSPSPPSKMTKTRQQLTRNEESLGDKMKKGLYFSSNYI